MIIMGIRLGVRHTQIVLYFFLLWISYTMRLSLSVGIVAMTDKDANPNPDVPTYEWNDKSVVLSSFFWGYIIPQLFAGQWCRIYGPRWFLVVAMFINSIGCFVIPVLADNLGSKGLMGCRIVQGLSQGFLFPCLHNLLGKWAPPSERSWMGTFVFSGTAFGTIVAMIATGLISSSWAGWPASFYTIGSIGLLCTVAWIAYGSDSPAKHKTISKEERDYIESSLGQEEVKLVPTPWRDIFRSIPFWAVIVASAGNNWAYTTLMTEMPSYMSKILNFDINTNGYLSAVPYLTFWILCVVSGSVSDLLINNGLVTRGGARKLFNSIGSGLPAAALLWLSFIPDDQVVLSVVLLIAAVGFNAAAFSGFLVNNIDLSPTHAGTLMGVSNFAACVVAIIAPLAVQVVVYDEKDKSLWRIIFITSACIYIVCDVVFVIFGSGEVQYWNDDCQVSNKNKKKSEECSEDIKEKDVR